MAEAVQSRSGTAGDVVASLRDWATHLAGSAVLHWGEHAAKRIPCGSPDVSSGAPRACPALSLFCCDVCGRPCCLSHARVDYLGGAICEPCIGEAKVRARGTPPKEESEADIRKAARILGVKEDASWDEIRTRFRELVFAHNADRPQSERSRQKNTDRLKKINWAFSVMKKREERKKEAA